MILILSLTSSVEVSGRTHPYELLMPYLECVVLIFKLQ